MELSMPTCLRLLMVCAWLCGSPLAAASITTPTDTIPDFGASPTIIAVASGAWSSPATWSTGVLPAAGDIVAIMPGVTVQYDVASAAALTTLEVRDSAVLTFATTVSTALTVGTLEVLPGGTLTIGTTAQPIASGVTARITIADQPLDLVNDPFQFGTGIVGMGTVTMCGQPRAPSFVRVAAEPHQGDTSLSLASAVSGWQPGDRLILPDSRQLNWNQRSSNNLFEIETLALSAVSADGRTLTLAQPLAFDHPGGADGYGVIDYLPHVEDLSRNIIISSQNPADVRGHVLMTWQATVDIRWVAFQGLGRTTNAPLDNTTVDGDGNPTHIGTNQIGRYPLHMHRLIGPAHAPANGFQFTLVGNAIDGGDSEATAKWGIDIHGSYYGLAHGNVVYNTAGAGISTEDGSECNNLIDHNCVFWVNGTGGRQDYGRDGDGFWLRGDNNWVVDNVAADVTGGVYCYGFNIFQYYLGDVLIPAAQGQEPSVTINSYITPILDFARNEAYCVPNGMTYWWIGTEGADPDPVTPPPESVIRSLVVWNQYQWGIFAYQSYDMTIDGMICRGDSAVLNSGNGAQGINFSDYAQRGLIIRHGDFQNQTTGLNLSTQGDDGAQTIDSCTFRCFQDVVVPGPWTVSAWGGGILPRQIVITDCDFDLSTYGYNGAGLPIIPFAVGMWLSPDPTRNFIQSDQTLLYGYNGDPTVNYQMMYPQQAADAILPQTTYNGDGSVWEPGSPVAGLTNAQNWATYGIATSGMVAPADSATLPEFSALVSPIDPSTQPTMRSTTTSPEITPPALPVGIDAVATPSTGTATGVAGGTTGGTTSGTTTGNGASSGGSTAPSTVPAVSGSAGSSGGCGLGSTVSIMLGLTWLSRRRRAERSA